MILFKEEFQPQTEINYQKKERSTMLNTVELSARAFFEEQSIV
jgi:hypothetical protein